MNIKQRVNRLLPHPGYNIGGGAPTPPKDFKMGTPKFDTYGNQIGDPGNWNTGGGRQRTGIGSNVDGLAWDANGNTGTPMRSYGMPANPMQSITQAPGNLMGSINSYKATQQPAQPSTNPVISSWLSGYGDTSAGNYANNNVFSANPVINNHFRNLVQTNPLFGDMANTYQNYQTDRNALLGDPATARANYLQERDLSRQASDAAFGGGTSAAWSEPYSQFVPMFNARQTAQDQLTSQYGSNPNPFNQYKSAVGGTNGDINAYNELLKQWGINETVDPALTPRPTNPMDAPQSPEQIEQYKQWTQRQEAKRKNQQQAAPFGAWGQVFGQPYQQAITGLLNGGNQFGNQGAYYPYSQNQGVPNNIAQMLQMMQRNG